jgi:uncharacterized protein YndB with AHSA1/START domain
MSAANEYHFTTRWRVKSSAEEAFEIISRPEEFPRWWPDVYLRVIDLSAGDEHGVGRRVRFHTKGWLPYTLDWESTVVEVERPWRLAITASGDFVGRGVWTFEQDGDWVNMIFDWRLSAEKPLLRYLSSLLKPIFSANHRWAMARGRKSLEQELARRARKRVPST